MAVIANLNTLELINIWYENHSDMKVRVNFPIHIGTGAQASAVVYFEIEPGNYLGTHQDSAEEIVLLLSGTVEASLGDEKGVMTAGQAVLIPAMVPHGIVNVGTEKARCVGFFASAVVESTFDAPLMPFGAQHVTPTPTEAVAA